MIIIVVLILLLLVAIIISLFVVFTNRKNQIIISSEKEKQEIKLKLQQTFNEEHAKAQIEIREETLRNISWELHDNIGQLMTLAKINAQLAKEDPSKINEVTQTISDALNELRSLSKSINPEYIKKLELVEAVRLEIARFNRLDHIESSLEIIGDIKNIDQKHEIILFRILQEFFTNTIKHSKATQLKVILNYKSESFQINAKDNGIGFSLKDNGDGIGIQNMINRAKIINASLSFDSNINQGTQMKLNYQYN